jgi:LmbE family N-acetylglucosaminyl deacetylase
MKKYVILMSKSIINAQIFQFYRWRLSQISEKYHEDDLSNPAVVFSPHFDDETLGCGGTILKKKKSRADIKLVFMTDGSKSHKKLISEEKLKKIRENEALAASRSLGLDSRDVYLLKFEETKLIEHKDSAIERVKEILLSQEPHEIFIPYFKEPSLWNKDHLATNRIVINALQILGMKVIIYEYPIWFWYHWPWVNTRVRVLKKSPKEWLHFIKFNPVVGLRLLRYLRCSVYIGDILEQKRTVLDHYKSQMTRLIPDARWATLPNFSNGEFLECFFQDHEIFRRYIL